MAVFRAHHLGSLIRPTSLLEARGSHLRYTDGEMSSDLASLTEKAIADAVQKQLEVGIRPITSGEYERTTFLSGVTETLDGMEVREARVPDAFRPGLPMIEPLIKMGLQQMTAVVASKPIRHVKPGMLDAWEMLKKAVPESLWKECKIDLPSLTWQHVQLARGRAYDPGVYASDREYLADMAAAYRAEAQILYDNGLRFLQIDDPQLLYFMQDSFRDALREDGIDPDELLDLYIWTHNEFLKGLPTGLHMAIHFCRGNMAGSKKGFISGQLETIASRLLKGLDYSTFYFEFDTEDCGPMDPLRYLPKGKSIVLGLVSTKTPDLEDITYMSKRVHEAASVISEGQGRSVDQVLDDSLGVSPQCGFASMSASRNVGSEERMWEKLGLVRQLAQSIWKDVI